MKLSYDDIVKLMAEYDSEIKQLRYKLDLKRTALKELREAAKNQKPAAPPAAPKRRGRPAAKAKTAAAPAAPKKRGRPAKAKTTTAAAPAAPKKRGRPTKAKTTTAAAPAAPKKRGRPAKAKTTTAAAPAAPKKRGRPAKAKTTTAAAPAAPKKRGRPAKAKTTTTAAPAAPKKRGRPAKTKTTTAAPKKRGTTRKSASKDRGGYKLNPWDDFIISTLDSKGKVMSQTEIQKVAVKSDLRKELKDTAKGVEGKVVRSIHKLVNKRNLLIKVQKEGRGYNYGLPSWGNGKLKVKPEYQ